MKKIYVHKQVISWEEYTYEVPDDFEDYTSLVDSTHWVAWEYLEDAAEYTGEYVIYNEEWEDVLNNNKK